MKKWNCENYVNLEPVKIKDRKGKKKNDLNMIKETTQ